MYRHVVTVIGSVELSDPNFVCRDRWLFELARDSFWKRFRDAARIEIWQRENDGTLDRDNGPAVIVDDHSGNRLHEEWRRAGQLHRDDDGPAYSGVEDDGFVQHWFRSGKMGRAAGPADIETDLETGVVRLERWVQDGVLHREGDVAYVHRSSGGIVSVERWAMEGRLHRTGGPAEIERDTDTGVIVEESWYTDGKLDRRDGPAWLRRDRHTGQVIEQMHFRNGEQVRPINPPTPSP